MAFFDSIAAYFGYVSEKKLIQLSIEHHTISRKYQDRLQAHMADIEDYNKLVRRWNNRVQFIKDMGGESSIRARHELLTLEQIKRMISLCHPDKHGGKQSAVDITAMLIQLKKQMEE